MKRLIIIFMGAMLLVGCGSKDAKEPEEIEKAAAEERIETDEAETLFERTHDILLVENDDLEVKLLSSKQERTDILDLVSFEFEIKNKQDKTFKYSFKEIKLDDGSYDVMNIGMEVFEVKPNETIVIDVSVHDYEKISFEEFIGGEFSYNDYSSNIPIAVEKISVYINE